MRALTLLSCLALTGLVLLAAPSAAADVKPTVDVVVEWGMQHDQMQLPENGRASMELVVHVTGVDFVCAQPLKFKVEIDPSPFPKWAGASTVPRSVPTSGFFVFDGLQPGLSRASAKGSDNNEARFDIAWDLDSAPVDAIVSYKVRGIVQKESDGVCSATPTFNTPWTPEMAVLAPPKPKVAAPDPIVCQENPLAPGCPAPATVDVPESVPFASTALFALAVIASAAAYRRTVR